MVQNAEIVRRLKENTITYNTITIKLFTLLWRGLKEIFGYDTSVDNLPSGSSTTADRRFILHFDIDCFHIQLLHRGADLGKPIIAIDSNKLILSCTKSAKKLGLARLQIFNKPWFYPNVTVLHIPNNKWGKPESKSARVLQFKFHQILLRNGDAIVEVEGDGAFMDVTKMVYRMQSIYYDERIVFEWEDNDPDASNVYDDNSMKLLCAARIAARILDDIREELGLRLSCGVGQSKNIAKLATSLNRPNKITILPRESLVRRVNREVNISNVHGLGGNLGDELKSKFGEDLTMYELGRISVMKLVELFGLQEGMRAHLLANGDDLLGPVIEKQMNHSLSCNNKYKTTVNNFEFLKQEIRNLCEEFTDRLNEELHYHHRRADVVKIEVISDWYNAVGNNVITKYSHEFEITRKYTKRNGHHKMSWECINGLRNDGFVFDRYFVGSIHLSVVRFVD